MERTDRGKGEVAMTSTIPAEVKGGVTFIFSSDGQGNLLRDPTTNNAMPCGTGFFVAVKNDSGQGPYSYLVTAKHVLKNSRGKDFTRIFLRLQKLEGNAEYIALDLIQGSKSVVYSHSDPSVDVAVVPMWPSEVIFDLKVIPEYMLATKKIFNEFSITEGSDIFFLELVTSYYGEHQDIPIFRFGHVAACPDDRRVWVDYPGQSEQHAQLYLIEAQSCGCNGGSPVFISLGADRLQKGGLILGSPVIKLAGIIRGRVNETNPGFDVLQSQISSTPITLSNIGIAAVTPSYFLDEILFSDELRKLRADHPIVTPSASSV
jgi:hypothetical protein